MRRALYAVLCLVSVTGCEKVLGVDFDDVAPLATNQSDGSTAACELALPNPPPNLTNTGGDQEVTIVGTTIEWGEAASDFGKKPPAYGFDIDGLCSGRGDPPPCSPPEYTKGDPTDGPQGEDNSVSKMIGTQWTSLGLSDPPLTTESSAVAIAEGRFAPLVLVRISDWIGGYDDEQVTVDWYIALPANDAPGGPVVPKLDGTDAWPLLSATPGSKEPAHFVDTKAYVSGKKFVARFPVGKLPLTTAYLVVNDVVMTGELEVNPSTDKWKLKSGLVAGWTDSQQIISQLPIFTSALLGFPLCTNVSTYEQQIKPWVCGTADTLIPGTPPGSACNAVSFGVGFSGVEVTLGGVGDAKPGATCPAGFDPANDSCANPVQ
jgi:hypothetical protein